MKKKLNAKEKELWARISRILWKDWDPIGVHNDEDEWDDEYDSYVPHVFRLTLEGSDHVKIAASLTSTIRQDIGLSRTDDNAHEIKVAKLIVSAKQDIFGN